MKSSTVNAIRPSHQLGLKLIVTVLALLTPFTTALTSSLQKQFGYHDGQFLAIASVGLGGGLIPSAFGLSTMTPQSATTTVGTIPATRRSSVRSYSGLVQGNLYSLCQGAPDVTNPIDGSRFFSQQLYLDVLHRNPDEIGWNNWTTTIASCGFEGACIYNMRIHTARGFLESSENFANNPLLTSPDSHIRNREYVRLCYVSFLGRPPDETGWNNWTDYLDSNPGGYNHVVGGFIYSWEYRGRFGNP